MIKEESPQEDYQFLFRPASTDDFWNAKFLLDEVGISYQVKGALRARPMVYGHDFSKFSSFNTNDIYIKAEDKDRALLVCEKLIQRYEQKEKLIKEDTSSLSGRFKALFRSLKIKP